MHSWQKSWNMLVSRETFHETLHILLRKNTFSCKDYVKVVWLCETCVILKHFSENAQKSHSLHIFVHNSITKFSLKFHTKHALQSRPFLQLHACFMWFLCEIMWFLCDFMKENDYFHKMKHFHEIHFKTGAVKIKRKMGYFWGVLRRFPSVYFYTMK